MLWKLSVQENITNALYGALDAFCLESTPISVLPAGGN